MSNLVDNNILIINFFNSLYIMDSPYFGGYDDDDIYGGCGCVDGGDKEYAGGNPLDEVEGQLNNLTRNIQTGTKFDTLNSKNKISVLCAVVIALIAVIFIYMYSGNQHIVILSMILGACSILIVNSHWE